MNQENLPGTAFLAFPEMKNILVSELSERFSYGSIKRAATIEGTSFVSSAKPSWYGDLLYCPDFVPKTDKNGNPKNIQIYMTSSYEGH